MHLSENPLSNGQKDLLRSRKPLGRAGPQVKKEITKHLDKSIRYLHNILKDTYNLNQEEVYDRINAQTVTDILENSLKKGYTSVYDFRTIELARTLFEISKNYLEQNPVLKVHDQLPEDIRRGLQTISDSYYILANTALNKEGNETISLEYEQKLRENLKQLEKSREELENKDQTYIEHESEKRKLQDKASKLDQEWNQMNNQINDLVKEGNTRAIKIIQGQMSMLKEKEKEINQKVVKIQNKQKKMLEPLHKEAKELYEKLNQKYNHLKPYFSTRNRLSEFSMENGPHKPSSEQTHGL